MHLSLALNNYIQLRPFTIIQFLFKTLKGYKMGRFAREGFFKKSVFLLFQVQSLPSLLTAGWTRPGVGLLVVSSPPVQNLGQHPGQNENTLASGFK
jgi:hypothetical protein